LYGSHVAKAYDAHLQCQMKAMYVAATNSCLLGGHVRAYSMEQVLGYLDDVAVGDSAAFVLKHFIVLEKTSGIARILG
jgi:hypothetical protein